MQVLIRRAGSLIDVSAGNGSPLPESILASLAPQLTYLHKQLLRGVAAWNRETGEKESMRMERRRLYRMEHGRLTTGHGFAPRIVRTLQDAGHEVRWLDLTPPRKRPNCYVPDWERLRANFNPRAKQMECLQVIAATEGGIINATMGFGKTHLFPAFCHLFPYARVAIVVKPRDVAARIARQLTKEFPEVGLVGGGSKKIGRRITVFTAGSMQYSDDDYDFLLCDEAHQLMSEAHSQMLVSSFRNTRNYAFSATPEGRLDGAHAKLEMCFGPEIFLLSYPEAVSLGLVVPIQVRWLPIRMDWNPAHNKADVYRMKYGIWENEQRNRLIAADVHRNYGADDQVLMAVSTIDHAVHLWQFLPEFTLCYSTGEAMDVQKYRKANMLPNNFIPITPKLRDQYRLAFEAGTLKKVIATDVWSTGVDFAGLQVLYRCDARESPILSAQWPGRVSRIYEGKGVGEVVDCIDFFDKTLLQKSRTRKKLYEAQGWTQIGFGRGQIG